MAEEQVIAPQGHPQGRPYPFRMKGRVTPHAELLARYKAKAAAGAERRAARRQAGTSGAQANG